VSRRSTSSDSVGGRARRCPAIREWLPEDRPREKLLLRGPQALTEAELLALILRIGTPGWSALDLARNILLEAGSLGGLAACSAREIMRMHGVGPAKAAELSAAFEIGRRVEAGLGKRRTVVKGPADVARIMVPTLRDRRQEVFHVLALDSSNAVTANIELSRGTLNASLVHPREVFKTAIDHRAAAIIVVHNHPSGNPEPSPEDLAVTRQLAEAGKLLGIPVHDHVIVAASAWTSLAEQGLL
jgi:DNA repair protein RadC